MPTSLPPTHEPEDRNHYDLGADAWAGIAVIVAMLIVGVTYWSGHANDASAAAPAATPMAGSSAALKDSSTGSDTAVQ